MLTIALIFIAVSLTVYYAAPPVKVDFSVKKRLPIFALERGVALLGMKYSVTRAGLGIKYSSVVPKRNIAAAKKYLDTEHAEPWRIELIAHKQRILSVFSSCKKSISASSFLGHVGKYPRIFLLSKYFIENTCGDITANQLTGLLSVFEEHAQLTEREKRALPDYIRFCLIGLLCSIVKSQNARGEYYFRGISDGAREKVDLDRITDEDYICGLVSGADGRNTAALNALFDANEINLAEAQDKRRSMCAMAYAIIRATLRSLDEVDVFARSINSVEIIKQPSARYIRFFKIALPSLIVLYAALTCVFASPRYVALFYVGSIITYFALRLPILLRTPSGLAFDFLQKINGFFSQGGRHEVNGKRAFLYECAYIDSASDFFSGKIFGGTLCLSADNRGQIEVVGQNGALGKLNIVFSCESKQFDLSRFDVYAEPHRYVYRAVSGAELAVEVFPSPTVKACVCRITAVNGNAESKTIGFAGLFASTDKKLIYIFTLGADSGDMPTDLRYSPDKKVISTSGKLSVPPFGKSTACIIVAELSSMREAESIKRTVCAAMEFDLDYLGMNAYEKKRFCDTEVLKIDCIPEHDSTAVALCPNLPKKETVLHCGEIGYTESGELYIDDTSDCNPEISGEIACRKTCICCKPYGVESICLPDTLITDRSAFYSATVSAFVMLDCDGAIWSPTLLPLGKGQMSALFSFGCTEYSCAYNGLICSQKCYASGDEVLFDIKLKNETDIARELTMTFSAISKGGKCACILCSEEVVERAEYKEAYYRRGQIVRAHDFLTGGNTPAATAVVKIDLPENGERRVIFSVSETTGEMPSIESADNALQDNAGFFSRLGKVRMHSDNTALDIAYRRALYGAYMFWLAGSVTTRTLYYLTCAIKYVNIASVKRKLIEFLKKEKCDVYLALAVTEYVRYSGDNMFLFADANGITAGEACMRALDNSIRDGRFCFSDKSIFLVKSIMDMLTLFADKAIDRNRSGTYITALCSCARYCSAAVKATAAADESGLVGLSAVKRAADLYISGEYDRAFALIEAQSEANLGRNAFMCRNGEDAEEAALIFSVITERLIGLHIRGERAKINPCVTTKSPQIEFDLLGNRDLRIVVDGSVECGNWSMRTDRISYTGGSIDLSNVGCDRITFVRDGAHL